MGFLESGVLCHGLGQFLGGILSLRYAVASNKFLEANVQFGHYSTIMAGGQSLHAVYTSHAEHLERMIKLGGLAGVMLGHDGGL